MCKISANIQTPFLTYQQRIRAFVGLGRRLQELLDHSSDTQSVFYEVITRANHENVWFTPDFCLLSLQQICNWLNESDLKSFIQPYVNSQNQPRSRQVAVICAGNIPLVGFHDILCVLLSGNILVIKPSQEDRVLPLFILQLLVQVEPGLESFIRIAQPPLKNFDAVIATGSSSSARQFEYYFAQFPRIVRKSRSSIAILEGSESETELIALMNDVLCYFGLGCRSVKLICFPESFDIQKLFKAALSFERLMAHHGYMNQYEYQRSLLLLESKPFLENNFLIFTASDQIFAPMGVVNYKRYKTKEEINRFMESHNESLQCIVSHQHTAFGQSQFPKLNDFADGVDTLKFLTNLS